VARSYLLGKFLPNPAGVLLVRETRLHGSLGGSDSSAHSYAKRARLQTRTARRGS
jgi:hypothetical protein